VFAHEQTLPRCVATRPGGLVPCTTGGQVQGVAETLGGQLRRTATAMRLRYRTAAPISRQAAPATLKPAWLALVPNGSTEIGLLEQRA
jgi:hypothetical protein